MKAIVSACLAGQECRFDCRHKLNQQVHEMVQKGEAIPVCPEQLGGLSTPRPPSERIGTKVMTNQGADVTEKYVSGAEQALKIALDSGVSVAYLKSKSPMCGYEKIYDGTFNKKLREGHGVFAELLLKNGIKVISVD